MAPLPIGRMCLTHRCYAPVNIKQSQHQYQHQTVPLAVIQFGVQTKNYRKTQPAETTETFLRKIVKHNRYLGLIWITF